MKLINLFTIIGWSKLYYEKLSNLYASPNFIRVIKSRRIKWAVHIARMGEPRNSCNIFVGKHERKTPLRRPRHRCEDNIRMDLRNVDWEGVGWMHMA
jgi:hypothetical protein